MAEDKERKRFREIVRTFFPAEPDLAFLEEAAELFAKHIPKPREIVTETVNQKMKFYGAMDIINSKVRGKLREFSLRAKSKNFSVQILRDGVKKLDRTYDELSKMSEYLRSIDAFEVNGEYVVHLKNFKWISDFLLTIFAREEIEFPQVFAIWDEIREV